MKFKLLPFLILAALLAACSAPLTKNTQTVPAANPVPPGQTQSTVSFAPKPDAARVTATPLPSPTRIPQSLDMDPEALRQKLLFSHTAWKTIFVDGTLTWYSPAGSSQPTQIFREQLWIDQAVPAYRRIGGTAGAAAQYFNASDGHQILEMDLQTGSSQLRDMPDFATAVAEFTPPTGFSDTIYGHPLAGTIGSPFDDRIFPTALGQREGTYTNIAIEDVAGRPCLVVDWSFPDGARASRYWVDLQTGVLLRGQDFGKGGGEDLQSEFVMDQVVFDPGFDAGLFSLQLQALPGWSDPEGVPLEEAQPLPAAGEQNPSELLPGTAGWPGGLYFFASDHVYMNETVRFLSLPRTCLEGSDPCPDAQEIAVPFPLLFSLAPLVWSPQGDVAAFAYPVSEDGNLAQLFLFNPADGTWTQLAQYNFIDPPLWSPDGQWLAFRTQDGLGGDEFYAMRRNGSGLTDLVSQGGLEESSASYRLFGWTSVGVLLGASGADGSQRFYTVPVDGSPSLLMPVAEPFPDWLMPSPDGNSLLLGRMHESRRLDLELADSFGVFQQTLASFSGGSLGWMVWSPDGSRFAFARSSADLPAAGMDVFVYNMRDGLLSQVYSGQTIGGLAFSPDGSTLVIQDDDPTGRHLFVVDLETFQQRLVQSPNVALDEWWLAPSWQP